MTGTSDFVLDVPGSNGSFRIIARGCDGCCRTGKLSAVGALVVAVVALSPIAARLATAARQFLVALDLQTVAPQTAETVALALADDTLAWSGSAHSRDRVEHDTRFRGSG